MQYATEEQKQKFRELRNIYPLNTIDFEFEASSQDGQHQYYIVTKITEDVLDRLMYQNYGKSIYNSTIKEPYSFNFTNDIYCFDTNQYSKLHIFVRIEEVIDGVRTPIEYTSNTGQFIIHLNYNTYYSDFNTTSNGVGHLYRCWLDDSYAQMIDGYTSVPEGTPENLYFYGSDVFLNIWHDENGYKSSDDIWFEIRDTNIEKIQCISPKRVFSYTRINMVSIPTTDYIFLDLENAPVLGINELGIHTNGGNGSVTYKLSYAVTKGKSNFWPESKDDIVIDSTLIEDNVSTYSTLSLSKLFDTLKKCPNFIPETYEGVSGKHTDANYKYFYELPGWYNLLIKSEGYVQGVRVGVTFTKVYLHYGHNYNISPYSAFEDRHKYQTYYPHFDYLKMDVSNNIQFHTIPYNVISDKVNSKTKIQYKGYLSVLPVDVEIGNMAKEKRYFSIYDTNTPKLTNLTGSASDKIMNIGNTHQTFEYEFNDTININDEYDDYLISGKTKHGIAIGMQFDQAIYSENNLNSYGKFTKYEIPLHFSRYTEPLLYNVNIYRVDREDNKDDEGNYIHIQAKGLIYTFNCDSTINISNNGMIYTKTPRKNYYTLRMSYKTTSETLWTTTVLESTNPNSECTIDSIYTGAEFDPTLNYDIKLELVDFFTTVSESISLKAPIVLIDYNTSGTAMAFGKMSEAGPSDIMIESIMPFIFSDKFNLHSSIGEGNLGMITQTGTNSLQYYDLVTMRTSTGYKQYAITCYDTDNRSYSSSTNLPLMRLAIGNGTYLDIGYRTMKYFQYWEDDYIEFAPEDTYCNINTNSTYFYFNKPIYMQGNLVATQSWVNSQLNNYATTSSLSSLQTTVNGKAIVYNNIKSIDSDTTSYYTYIGPTSDSSQRMKINVGRGVISIGATTGDPYQTQKTFSFSSSFTGIPIVIITSHFGISTSDNSGAAKNYTCELHVNNVTSSSFRVRARTTGFKGNVALEYIAIGKY